MHPDPLTSIFLFLGLTAIFLLPGSMLLALSRTWRYWPGLQRYIVAIGLSLAFYTVLFYTARFWLPGLTLGPYKMGALLIIALIITGWTWWKHRTFLPSLDGLEWAAVIIFGLTFISRFWIAYQYPFPAWSDSLHHTLLTQLTAQQGALPHTMNPFFPNGLDMYHLGLYAISGTVEMLTRVPSHTALLWTAQFLNSICAFGIYLALDRYVGRTGAIVGAVTVGLFSTHPALWVNWGRFTQLSSLAIMFIAWVITLETLNFPARLSNFTKSKTKREYIWFLFFSSLGTAAVFLFHFRVAAFYLMLLAVTAVYILWQANDNRQRLTSLKSLAVIGMISLLLILPHLMGCDDRVYCQSNCPQARDHSRTTGTFDEKLLCFPTKHHSHSSCTCLAVDHHWHRLFSWFNSTEQNHHHRLFLGCRANNRRQFIHFEYPSSQCDQLWRCFDHVLFAYGIDYRHGR